jgi:predicted nucleic acid-binding protein
VSAVVLDSGPLGLLSNPSGTAQPVACRAWLKSLRMAGWRIIVPEITDYEVRRESIRTKSLRALTILDSLCATHEYLPITTLAMRLAADMWAKARNAGLPTSAAYAIDGDVILSAQTFAINTTVVVATENPAQLSRFVAAELGSNIVP